MIGGSTRDSGIEVLVSRKALWMGLGTTLYVAGLGDLVRLDRYNCSLGICLLAEANDGLSGRLCTLGACASVLVCYITGEPPAWRWGDRK